MNAVLQAVGRPEVTLLVTRGAARLMGQLGLAPLLEAPLPNGRRADIMALGRRGEIAIVEVKSSPEDFRSDAKWREYLPYCDRFYFAVSTDFPRDILPEGPGVMVADGFGGAILREPIETILPGPRRKALTLDFARLAAWRTLAAPVDPVG